MGTVILNQRVKDYNTFKSVYDGDKARRDGYGMKELALGRRVDDPGSVYIIWEMADPSKMDSIINSPELQQKLREATVEGVPEYFVLE